MLLTLAALILFQQALSISAAGESDSCQILEGDWEVFDGYFGDSNLHYVHIGTLSITGSEYLFTPEMDAFISPEMSERFGFIETTKGILWFEYREGVENTLSYETDTILGTISFNGGEGYLIRTDLENGKLCLTSAVSEIEMFRIFKPLITENTLNTSE